MMFFEFILAETPRTDERFRNLRMNFLVALSGQQQDEAEATSGQDAYRETRAIINVPFTSAESARYA